MKISFKIHSFFFNSFVAALVLIFFGSISYANEIFEVCRADGKNECSNYAPDAARVGCKYKSHQQIGARFCTIYDGAGNTMHSRFRVTVVRDKSGGSCGVSLYRVNCLDIDTGDIHYACKGERRTRCKSHFSSMAYFNCKAKEQEIGEHFCRIYDTDGKSGVPAFNIRYTKDKSEDQCGYTKYRINCFN